MSLALKAERKELGNFSSVVCLKAIVVGIEEALGEKAAAIALMAAGRQRGKQLAEELNLANKHTEMSLEEVALQAGKALGKDGTHLCIINKIEQEGETYKVYTSETVCSAGKALGKDGTHLCIINKIEQEGETYKVYTSETVCSAGEAEGSQRQCTFTLGALQGFLEVFLGKRLRGKHTESVLRGDEYDLLEYTIL
jgi:predicted hydrocarbon binding protein